MMDLLDTDLFTDAIEHLAGRSESSRLDVLIALALAAGSPRAGLQERLERTTGLRLGDSVTHSERRAVRRLRQLLADPTRP